MSLSRQAKPHRSDPTRCALAEFTLSRRVPEYVGRAKEAYTAETARRKGEAAGEFASVLKTVNDKIGACDESNTGTGSIIYANKPGDGSAREQAASCQKVSRRLGQHCTGVRYQTLPQQLYKLGYSSVYD